MVNTWGLIHPNKYQNKTKQTALDFKTLGTFFMDRFHPPQGCKATTGKLKYK